MSDSSDSPWIAIDDHDAASPQDERRRPTPSQPSDFTSVFPSELLATSNSILNYSASSTSTSGRPSASAFFTPSPTGIPSSHGTSYIHTESTPQTVQWSLDPQRYPQSPLPAADSSSSEHEFPSRASPKRRLSCNEILTRGQRGHSMTSPMRPRGSTRVSGLASRRSSFTPDSPIDLHPSTSLRTGRSLGAASSTYASVSSAQQHSPPIISPPPDFATSVSLRQQQLTVEADTSAAGPGTAPPLVPEARAVSDFEEELRFLRDQWTSVCITLSSLRNTYLAVAPSSSSTANTTAAQEESSSTAGSQLESSSTQEITNFPVPSSISVASFVGMAPPNRTVRSSGSQRRGRRSNRRDRGRASSEQTQGEQHQDGIHPDVHQEILIGYDDAMLQIRQLEFKVETLEAEIRRLVEESSDPSRSS